MAETRQCSHCGGELPADAPLGLCPKCVMQVGVDSQRPTVDSPAGSQGSHATGAFTPPAPADLAARFPQLEILELLGQGGMGAVYKARQPGLDRLVALKILPPGMGADPAFAERFTREARSLARLNHPNVVAVYDFGQAGDLYYFLMEYIDGVNLRQMQRARRLDPKQALEIVIKVCEALQYAHDEGIVHRDIKPENILLDKKGRVKIADFGLAKLLGRAPADFTLTSAGQMLGTPAYMAPEQVERPGIVDQRADIYSLGVVFYEMLTGELPLGRFQAPSQMVHVDVRLDEVVLKALEKQPERRYQHASEVKTDVEQISITPTQAAPGTSATPARATPRHCWWFKVPAGGLLATGILGCQSTLLLAVFLPQTLWRTWKLPGGRSPTMGEEIWMNLDTLSIALVYLVLGLVAGVLIIVGSIKMMRLRSPALAKTSAILAMIPLPNPVTWLLGFPIGIWALAVLSREDVKAAFNAKGPGSGPPAAPTGPTPGYGGALPPHAMRQMLGLSIGMVMCALLMTFGVATLVYAWVTGTLWQYFGAWMGSFVGCFVGGAGGLIGSWNSYRRLEGRGDLMEQGKRTWLDHIVLVYGVVGAMAFLTAASFGVWLGEAVTQTLYLIGALMAIQGFAFLSYRSAVRRHRGVQAPAAPATIQPAQAAAQNPVKGRKSKTAWIVAAIIVGALLLLSVPVIVAGLAAFFFIKDTGSIQSAPPSERHMSSASAGLSESDGPRTTTYYWGHNSGQGSSNPDWERVVTKTGVEVDRAISSTNSGQGSLKVVADGPTTVRLFEHGPTAGLYKAGPYDVDNSRLTYQAKLRTWGLQGRAYLEMWCHFPGGEEYFSRGLDKPLSGTNDWTSVETSFLVKGAREPDNVRFNLVIDGKGTVWIDDVGLTLRPPAAKRGG
jgi:predicted Ser/Thr protein kinase